MDPRPVPYLEAEVELIDADGFHNPIAKTVAIRRATTVRHNSGLICVPTQTMRMSTPQLSRAEFPLFCHAMTEAFTYDATVRYEGFHISRGTGRPSSGTPKPDSGGEAM